MLNKEISLTGNLGRDPESQYTPNGKLVCKFSIAVQAGWGDNKTVDWYKIEAWEKVAEILQNSLSKGSRIQVRGDFKLDTWLSKEGEAKAGIVVTVRDFQFLSSKKAEREEEEGEPEYMKD